METCRGWRAAGATAVSLLAMSETGPARNDGPATRRHAQPRGQSNCRGTEGRTPPFRPLWGAHVYGPALNDDGRARRAGTGRRQHRAMAGLFPIPWAIDARPGCSSSLPQRPPSARGRLPGALLATLPTRPDRLRRAGCLPRSGRDAGGPGAGTRLGPFEDTDVRAYATPDHVTARTVPSRRGSPARPDVRPPQPTLRLNVLTVGLCARGGHDGEPGRASPCARGSTICRRRLPEGKSGRARRARRDASSVASAATAARTPPAAPRSSCVDPARPQPHDPRFDDRRAAPPPPPPRRANVHAFAVQWRGRVRRAHADGIDCGRGVAPRRRCARE
jgi:hypothetical protein